LAEWTSFSARPAHAHQIESRPGLTRGLPAIPYPPRDAHRRIRETNIRPARGRHIADRTRRAAFYLPTSATIRDKEPPRCRIRIGPLRDAACRERPDTASAEAASRDRKDRMFVALQAAGTAFRLDVSTRSRPAVP